MCRYRNVTRTRADRQPAVPERGQPREPAGAGGRDGPPDMADETSDFRVSITELQAVLLGTQSIDGFLPEVASLAAWTSLRHSCPRRSADPATSYRPGHVPNGPYPNRISSAGLVGLATMPIREVIRCGAASSRQADR